MNIQEVKNYLRSDIEDDEDTDKKEEKLITDCIAAAKAYLFNATGIEYHDTDEESLEKTFLLQLIADMYENRRPSVRPDAGFIWQSIILQLSLKGEA